MAKRIEDYILAAENTEGKRQRRLIFKRKRGNEVLTREQVKAIKKGRKLLRKDLKKKGLKSKQDFEVVATSQGLYFDKRSFLVFWWMKGCGFWALLGAALLLLLVLLLFSWVTELRGHFTISLDRDLHKEGFELSETLDFANPTTYLFATPAEDVLPFSINDLPVDINQHEGVQHEDYFAYTFFVRNGPTVVDYTWDLCLNSESRKLSDAMWVMLFQDDKMLIYAEPTADGGVEALPGFDDDTRGYINPKLMDQCAKPEEQYQLIATRGLLNYYRVVPINFLTESLITNGVREDMQPGEIHKYTVVIWLEGDDPQCVNDLMGGHAGMEFRIELLSEEEKEKPLA